MKKDDYERIECPTSVYVMDWGGKAKIGIARDPEMRLRQLQLANPGAVKLVGHRLFSTRLSAAKVERALHQRFKAKRLMGEWFDVAPSQAIAALMAANDPKLHHPHWHPDMPAMTPEGGILGRWKWHRDNDLVFGTQA